jgi:hypothetical protein
MSFPSLRKRIPSETVVNPADGTIDAPLPAKIPPQRNFSSGGFSRLMNGLFGVSTGDAGSQSAQVMVPHPKNGFYAFHEGDQFTAGAPSFVFDYPNELPLYTIWGRAFLRKPNTFVPFNEPQMVSQANIVINGIGGLQAGQFVLQGLEEPNQ